MPCCSDCGAIIDEKSPVKKGCCKTNFIDPLYVPVYDPKCCPDPVNMDPKHNEVYQKPTLCRSEPLSHAEYIRKLKANNGVKLSVAASKAVTVGEGVYKRTIWTSAGDACSLDSDLVLPAVPAVLGHGKARDAWQYTEMKGAYAGRGTVSKFDSVNRTEDMTRLRRQGLAIAADDSFMAPANMKRVLCEVCTLMGTTDVDPGSCGLCGPESVIVSPVRAGSLYFSGVGGGWLQDSSPTLRTSLPQGSTSFTTEFFINCNSDNRERIIVAWGTTAGGQYNGIKLNNNDTINSYFYADDTSVIFPPITDQKWHHIAVQWEQSTGHRRIYADGILMLDDTPATPNVTGYGLQIGHSTNDGGDGTTFSGYLSNIRITNGIALYSGDDEQFPNFDVTSGPFSAEQPGTNNVSSAPASAVAALFNTNYHYPGLDSSTHSIDIDVSGTVVSSRENPFSGPGSLYFNTGEGAYLTIANDMDLRMRTGDFTIEWFMRMPATEVVYPRIFTMGSAPDITMGVSIEGANHAFYYWYGSGTAHYVADCNIITVAAGWTHYAISRSGTTTRFFENGTQLGSDFTDPTDYNDRGNSLFIGNQSIPEEDLAFKGYISNFRWVKGTGLYTSNFYVPTAPLVAVENTKLLLLANTNDTAVIDSSGLDKVVVQNGVTWSNSIPSLPVLVLENAIPNFTYTTNTFVGGTEPATWQAVASGQLKPFMNGTYLTTGSHFYGGNNVTNGSHQSFKRNLAYGGQGWVTRTLSNTYDGLTGVYTGSTSTTISSAAVLGEYITITAPYSFILKQYNLVSGNNNIDGATATSWVIGGSNNGGTSWTHVDTRTGIAMPGRTATIDLESNTVSYSSYILVVTANAPKVGPNHAAANIDAWNLETLM